MKKLLLGAALVSCLLTSCSFNLTQPPHEKYIEEIKNKIEIKEETNWCYTYQEAQPKSKKACIIDVYIFNEDSNSIQTTWYCYEEESGINCQYLYVKNF